MLSVCCIASFRACVLCLSPCYAPLIGLIIGYKTVNMTRLNCRDWQMWDCNIFVYFLTIIELGRYELCLLVSTTIFRLSVNVQACLYDVVVSLSFLSLNLVNHYLNNQHPPPGLIFRWLGQDNQLFFMFSSCLCAPTAWRMSSFDQFSVQLALWILWY